MHIGTRCFERDRGQDRIRGGVVIAVLDASQEVVVATAWGRRTKGRRANVPALDVTILLQEDIDPATVAPCSPAERVELARAIAAMLGDRKQRDWTDQDVRDLGTIRELLMPPVEIYPRPAPSSTVDAPAYAGGITWLEDTARVTQPAATVPGR